MSRQASGLKAWIYQRASAIYMILFIPYVLGYFLFSPPASHADWQSWVSHPVVSLALLLFFASMLIHAWIGIRDVLIDYIHPVSARYIALGFFAFILIACAGWTMQIIILAHAG